MSTVEVLLETVYDGIGKCQIQSVSKFILGYVNYLFIYEVIFAPPIFVFCMQPW